jgi:hypothetical protein
MDHERILRAYIHRLPSAQLRELADKAADAEHASMNLGNRSQLEAHTNIDKAVKTAVSRIGIHDREIIEGVVEEEYTATEEV